MASTTAKDNRFTAVSPATARLRGRPAWTSIRYCSAPPTAPPPGAIFASALPASCELITAGHDGPRMARYCSAQTHAMTPVWSANISPSQAGESRSRSSHEPSVSSEARRHEVERYARDGEPERRSA